MSDVEYLTGTEGDDVLDGGAGLNDYTGGLGNDFINGMEGDNTIHFNLGDGVDSVSFAPPRNYQFADFLTAAMDGLGELENFSGSEYTNDYFAEADRMLTRSLPDEIAEVLQHLRPNGGTNGIIDPADAQAAFTALIDWINAPTRMVIEFGAGIELSDLSVQIGSIAAYGAPAEFSVAVNGTEGFLFQLGRTDNVAGDMTGPPVLDIEFHFADGSVVTADDLLASPDAGVIGQQFGTSGDDFLRGSLSSDQMYAEEGNDKADAGAGFDTVYGGDGDDALAGGAGGDYLFGEAGNDVLAAGRDGGAVSGGAGNDVYVFNRGDGVVSIDNTGNWPGEVDTISFGKDVDPASLVASVDPNSGFLTLRIAGTDDQLTMPWFDASNGMAAGAEYVVGRVQFIDAQGHARVFDLEGIVGNAFPDPASSSPDASIQLFGEDAAAYELTGTVAPAGGLHAVNYAVNGDLFVNFAPTSSAVVDQAVQEDSGFSFAIPANTFVDPEGETLSFTATQANGDPLPAWLEFDAATGTFTGTPGNADVGTFVVKVTASDSLGQSTSQTFNLNVENVNDAPSATPGVADAFATEDAAFAYTLAADTFADIDVGDSLSYSASMADGSALPSWLHFDAATLTFSGTPENADVGMLSVKVTASDGEASVSKAVDINVANTNDAPTATAGTEHADATEDAAFSYMLPADTFADVDLGDSLSYSATMADGSALPSWLQFDSATGAFSGTPANGDVGSLSVKVTATDSALASATKDLDISVANTNDAPTATAGSEHADAVEDAAFSYTLPAATFADVDLGDSLTYSATMADGAALPSWLQFDRATGVFSGTPANGDVGSLSVKVTATDSANASATKDLDISTANTNDAPTATAGVEHADALEDAAFSYTLPAATFADVDLGDSLTYSATMADGAALPSWLQFDSATGAFSGTPANGDVGSLSVKVTATDSAFASATKDVDISVANTNDAPTATAGSEHADAVEDAAFNYMLPADTFADVDLGDSLTYSATMADGAALPSWLQFDSATGVFSGTPANGDVGSLSVKVTATDSAHASVSKDLDISVANTNDAPTATAGHAHALATEDASFSYALPADTFADVDLGDTLSYSATMADGSALPSWLQFDTATGAFSGTPANADVGSLAVHVTATDAAHASATKALDISIANTNDAPTVAHPIADHTATEDAQFNFALPGNVFADVDLGDSMTLSATLENGAALPSWLSFNAATGVFSGTPGNSDVGTLGIRVTARDQAGTSVSDVFNLAVANTNDAPTLVQPVADQHAVAGSSFNLVVPGNMFADVDAGDSLSMTARLSNGDPLPAWLSFNPNTRTLSGTPATNGTFNIQITATDLSGASVSDVFALNVDAPVPPSEPGKTLIGGNGDDRLVGGSGNDTISGGKGKDQLIGGAGDDILKFSEDAKWSKTTRKNAGSPGVSGTGDSVNLKDSRRSYDVFDGGAGYDTLVGTSGNDAILLDDSSSPAAVSGPRITDIEEIDAEGGNDIVDLTSKRYSYGDVTINGGSGNDVLWASGGNDVVRGDSGNDKMNGGAGNDYLDGGSGNDELVGGQGIDILQGGSGKDKLSDTSGNSLLDGGKDNDSLTSGSNNSFMIGGKGNDGLVLGGGYDIIAFNKGDGRDTVSSKDGDATLSLGGGIRYQDLSLRRSGKDLVLDIGSSDRITFEKWYDGKKYQAVSKLQVVAESMSDFNPNGSDSLRDDKIETFDFKGLVETFDAARAQNHGLSKWTLTNAMAQFHLGGSDSSALGGDLGYQYGLNGTLAGIAVAAAQEVTGSTKLGKQAQSLQSQTDLQDGAIKLT